MKFIYSTLLFFFFTASLQAIESPQPLEAPADITISQSNLDHAFLILCAALVFLMQAGFALLELGYVRSKNCLNVLMKNSVDFCVAMLCFLFVGFSLMFSNSMGGWIGGDFLWLSSEKADSPIWSFWIFQAVFVATAATITSGAMAERTKFSGYLIYTIFISTILYPILGHWSWAGLSEGLTANFDSSKGWLETAGFHDFAGSTVVHAVGGACALAGIIVIGPRRGRFNSDGSAVLIPNHNVPLIALGSFILIFGWFGFNCGSLRGAGPELGRIAVNTLVAGAAGGIFSMFTFWLRDGRPEPLSVLNGILGGLVAITACCNVVTPGSAALIGIIAGLVSTLGAEFLLKLRLDDVVGAVPVHFFNGIWGTLAVAIFHQDGFVLNNLGTQFLGAFVISIGAFAASYLAFKVIDATVGLRATDDEEEDGLDFSEHASSAYPEFKQS